MVALVQVVPEAAVVKFTFVVQEQGGAEVRRVASAVSDPSSPAYGKYLTQAQLDGITRPAAADMSAVKQWLTASQVSYTVRVRPGPGSVWRRAAPRARACSPCHTPHATRHTPPRVVLCGGTDALGWFVRACVRVRVCACARVRALHVCLFFMRGARRVRTLLRAGRVQHRRGGHRIGRLRFAQH